MKRTSLWKSILGRGFEFSIASVVVLAFFLALLGILSLSFPRGTGLKELMGFRSDYEVSLREADMDLELPELQVDPGEIPLIASLTRVFRRVKDKAPGAFAWNDATSGKRLREGHAIHTLNRSGATIRFVGEDSVNLGENSLLVLRRVRRQSEAGSRRASLLLLEGELEAHTEASRDGVGELEIEAASGTINVRPSAGSGSGFKVRVNPDRSTTFSLFEGQGEIRADGRSIPLAPNFAVTVSATGEIGAPIRLPDAPLPAAPVDRFVAVYRRAPSPVKFSWPAQAEADEYRVTIARDSDFEEIVGDEWVKDHEFSHGNLRAGSYYWRVRGVKSGAEGPASPTRQLEVVQDLLAPELRVDFPSRRVARKRLEVRGTVEPGCQIFVGSDEAVPDVQGRFTHTVSLNRGVNVIVVEAMDSAGNVAYESALVHAEF